jgi:quercetin dioxygenase-like cupin family protein
MMTTFLLAAVGLAPAMAQDPVTVRPDMAKVEFENEQIRVLRVRYPAHGKFPMHSHSGRVVVALTDSRTRATALDGTVQERARRAGDIYWGDSITHQAENMLDAPIEVIEIEVKKASTPGIAVAPKPVDATKLKEPVPVEQEPHHHVVLQNQYVRVLDVLFPVGDAALLHTHSNDNVSVELSGDKTKSQPMAGEWSAPGTVVPGRVGFHKAAGQPYTHRVGSAGEKPYHVIDVEIFPAPAQ